MPERLFLIDAMAQIYRAHFAMSRNPLFTTKGENVSAVFGFTNILLNLLRTEKPDRLAVVFDAPERTFRQQIYEEYKATRDKMPDELVAQLPRIDEILEAFNLTKVILPGYEADDLVGTLAKQGAAKGYDVYLVTGDKDYYQLVDDNVFFYNPSKRSRAGEVEVFGPEGVKEIFGVLPDKVIDVLALAGDTSDNVPGVPKIGMKTAVKLVEQYGNMEAALSHWEEVGGKTGENLRDFREQALMSKRLVTIRREAPISVSFDDLILEDWKGEKARKLFVELGFKTLLRHLETEPLTIESQSGGIDYTAVTDEDALKQLIDTLGKSSRFAFDTETTSTDAMNAELVGMSFSVRTGQAWYVPVNYFQFKDMDSVPNDGQPLKKCGPVRDRLLDILRPVLVGGPGKITQNGKYDFLVLKKYGLHCAPLAFDTMLADYLINPGQRGHNIDALALNYLKIKKVPTNELIGTGKGQITMDHVPLTQITHYACEDADVTLRLMEILEQKLEQKGLQDLMETVELPISDVLLQMEANGIKLDVGLLNKMSKELAGDITQLEAECHLIAGTEFNLNSPKQLQHILFEKLNLPTKMSRKTKTGYSTDQDVLEKLAPLDPLPQKLLEYRQLQKLQSTYVEALPALVNKATGRVHTSYNQAVAATGRLSSTDPNLQNIPIRTEMGAEIRRAFIADEGNLLLSADYSQVELRMMAHLSGDKDLIAAFEEGQDIHTATAAKIFRVNPADVSKQQRSASKAVNFGVLFGMREYGLSSRLGISIKQAKEFIEGYFGAYPRVEEFINELLKAAYEDGYVSTILGRRRPLPELKSSNKNVKMQAERMAIATTVQGSAADLIKLAMITLHRDLKREKPPYKMLLQVHDELIFEIPEGEEEQAAKWVGERMESAMDLKVPLVVDAGWGKNWLEAH